MRKSKRLPTSVPLLHAECSGSGPVLVLLHGFLLSSYYWKDLSSQLSKEYRVIAIDLLGFGKSPKPRRSRYSYEEQLASIEATLKLLGVKGKFTLMGHSMGALLALRFARSHPRRVKRLVLANMPVLLNYKQARREILGKNLIYRLGLSSGTQRIIWPTLRVLAASRLLPRKLMRDLGDRAGSIFQHTPRSRLQSFRNVILHASVEADLAALRVQTNIISGYSDRLAYLDNLRHMMLNAHITSTVVDGAHHLVRTNPELFVALLARPRAASHG